MDNILVIDSVNYRADSAKDRFLKYRKQRHLAEFNYRRTAQNYESDNNGPLVLPRRSKTFSAQVPSQEQLKLDLLKLHHQIVNSKTPAKKSNKRRIFTCKERSLPEKPFLSVLPSTSSMSSFERQKTEYNKQFTSRATSSKSLPSENKNKNVVVIEKCLKDSVLAFENSSIKVKDYWMPEENCLDQGLYHKGKVDPNSPLQKNGDLKKFSLNTSLNEKQLKREATTVTTSGENEYYSLYHSSGCIVAKKLDLHDPSTIRIGNNGELIKNSPKNQQETTRIEHDANQDKPVFVPLSWDAQLSDPKIKTLSVKSNLEQKQECDKTIETKHKKELIKFNNYDYYEDEDVITPEGFSLKLMQMPKSPFKESALHYIKRFSRNLENQFLFVEGKDEYKNLSVDKLLNQLNVGIQNSKTTSTMERAHTTTSAREIKKPPALPQFFTKVQPTSQQFVQSNELKIFDDIAKPIRNTSSIDIRSITPQPAKNTSRSSRAPKSTGRSSRATNRKSLISSGKSVKQENTAIEDDNAFLSISNSTFLHERALDNGMQKQQKVKSRPMPSSPERVKTSIPSVENPSFPENINIKNEPQNIPVNIVALEKTSPIEIESNNFDNNNRTNVTVNIPTAN